MSKKKSPKNKKSVSKTKNFPVIGIGASAGGLEALKQFFSSVPQDSGMAYIVVVHMMSGQKSLMPELLQKITSIPVLTVKNRNVIKPDHIYINPPDKHLTVCDGKFRLLVLKKDKVPFSINEFLTSLAIEKKDMAAGIILSGTGTDGSMGIQEINKHGGLVAVQSKESAKYDGMPQSAVRTGTADIISPAGQMFEKIHQYYQSKSGHDNLANKDMGIDDPNWLNKIFSILRNRVGHDFSYYKKNTLLRRISRRMGLKNMDHPNAYLDLLEESPNEANRLFQELLIGVTNFFRDPESFEQLEKKSLLNTLSQMKDEETFRIWVPGCSTGEEVYSLAIVFKECLDQLSKRVNLQLFGTDIDPDAIDKAREGVYPRTITGDVNPQRLKRYFVKENNAFRIRKEIRDCAIFSTQDVVKDPPFSKLNLVCCRNLMIYLNSEAQSKIIPLFHYTLVTEGILMLGSSETIGSYTKMFKPIDNKWKIFRKKEIPVSLREQIYFPSGITHRTPPGKENQFIAAKGKINLSRIAQTTILNQLSPVAVITDEKGDILHIQGKSGKYLEPPSGPPSSNILDMAREGLKIELSSALREICASGKEIYKQGIRVKTNGDYQHVNLRLKKIHEPRELSGRIMVVFEESGGDRQKNKTNKPGSSEWRKKESHRFADLEKELQNTRESHQITIEELESSNEELKSTNEELQSSNEELQSTNEELESSKEELQSLNEELQTVNSELQCKLDELTAAHDDMRNLMNSTEIATIFVDNNINIKRFTQETTAIVNLIQSDIGRPLNHVVSNLDYDDMIDDIEKVLKSLMPKNLEVKTTDGSWYSMRIMPYRTTDNRIEGAVITFANISDQKQAAGQMQKAWQLTRAVFDLNNNPLAVINTEGTIIIANSEFSSLMNASPETVVNQKILALKQNKINESEETVSSLYKLQQLNKGL